MYKKGSTTKNSVKNGLKVTVSTGFVLLGFLTMIVTFSTRSSMGTDQLLLSQLMTGFGSTAWGLLGCLDPNANETAKVFSFAVLGCAMVLTLLAIHTIAIF